MSDTPEQAEQRRKAFEELRKLSEEIGWYDDPTPEEIVAQIKQIRKEMAEGK